MSKPPQFCDALTPHGVPVRRCPVPRGDAPRRILIVRLGASGDVLMATPLAAALRAAYPSAWLTWMVEHTHREAIDANPYVDELLVWDGSYFADMLPVPREGWAGQWRRLAADGRLSGWEWLPRVLRARRRLRRRRFDTLITFHGEEWPALARFSGAQTRIGVFDIFPQFNPPHPEYRRCYTTSFCAADLPAHRTDIHLLPLGALGLAAPEDKRMSLGYTAEDAAAVDTFLAESGVGAPFVVLAPRTTWESRNWPEERYAELGDALARRAGCRVVLTGSYHERPAVERVAARMRPGAVRAAGLFGFRRMAALIARASLLVSGDTGPMHAAAAVGTPYVALFGPTPAAGRAPIAGRGRVLSHPVPCGPCDLPHCGNAGDDHIRCLRLISVSEALAAAEGLLAGEDAPLAAL